MKHIPFLFGIALLCTACASSPKPYDEMFEFPLPDSTHLVTLNFDKDKGNVYVNMFLDKQGITSCRSRYIGAVHYLSDEADYTFPLEQNLLAKDLSRKEVRFYQDTDLIQMDVTLVPKEQAYYIRFYDSNCKALNMTEPVKVASTVDFRRMRNLKWMRYGMLALLLLWIVLRVIKKKTSWQKSAGERQYQATPKELENMYQTQTKPQLLFTFHEWEAVAFFVLSIAEFGDDWSHIKFMKRAMKRMGDTPQTNYTGQVMETMILLATKSREQLEARAKVYGATMLSMSDDQRRFAVGLLACTLVSDKKYTQAQIDKLNRLRKDLKLRESPQELGRFWMNTTARIID